MTLGITLDQARAIVAGTLAAGHERGFNPLTVVVLDAGGHVTAVEREDGSSAKRFEIAHGKAFGALSLGMGGRAVAKRAVDQPTFIAAVSHVIGGSLVPVPGGVLLRDASGTLLGAAGASGDLSENDEAALLAGIAAAGLTGEP